MANDPAESAWQNLRARLPEKRPAHPPSRLQSADAVESNPASNARSTHGDNLSARSRTDWRAMAQESREFIARYPESRRVNEARKLELTAELTPLRGRGQVTPEIQSKIDAWLADVSIPEPERYDISALAKEAGEDFAKVRTHEDSTRMRIGHARELTREFPSDDRGYGYMLAVAKSSPSPQAMAAAGELLAANAPEEYKKGAASLLAQRRMEGKPLDVAGLELGRHKGKTVVIYTWSSKRPAYIALFKRWSAMDGVALIGINTDSDINAAKVFAASQSVPGALLYDGNGMDGPLTSQLRIQMQTSVYIVGADGVLLDTCGHLNTLAKLAKLAAAQSPPGLEKAGASGKGASQGGGL